MTDSDFDFEGLQWEPEGPPPEREHGVPPWKRRRLPPARREPLRERLQSRDVEVRTCVHEIARALEEYATKDYVPLYGTRAEFEAAAVEIVENLSTEKCQLRH